MPPKTKSISELRQEIEEKESKIADLQKERDAIAKRLEKIDSEVAMLTGKPSSKTTGRARPKQSKAAPKVPKAAKKSRRGPRRKGRGGASLVDTIREVLAEANRPMRVKEIEKAVLEAGYKTASKSFYGIVASAVRDEDLFERVNRGQYKLK